MMTRKKKLLLPLLVVLGLSECRAEEQLAEESVVRLHVKNLTAEIVTLKMGLTLDGKPAKQVYEFTQELAEIVVRIKKDQLLGPGLLSVQLTGLTSGRCEAASGHHEENVSIERASVEVDVTMQPIFPAKCLQSDVRPNLVKIPKGSFTMGSPMMESGRDSDETQHSVTLTTDFWMTESEVTQRQYQNLMGSNPSYFKGDDLPVEQVSWFDAVTYCNALSVKENLPLCYQISGMTVVWADTVKCTGYRLPTEAEWEYAANPASGMRTVYAGSDSPDDVAWHSGNAGNTTHAVKTKTANARGLYDLSGNVWEWLWDGYQSNYEALPSTDPLGASLAASQVLHGGSWSDSIRAVRVADRYNRPTIEKSNGFGIRIVRSSP